jgi:NADPH2:quinone reductase
MLMLRLGLKRGIRALHTPAGPHKVVVAALAESPLQVSLNVEPLDLPDNLDDDAVLVEVKSSAVSWVDLLMLAGQYQQAPPLPFTPGLAYAGSVVNIGSSVSAVSVGDRVAVDIFEAGPRSYGAYQREGGFSTHATAPQQACRPVPEGFSYDEAACFSGAYETAWHALVHCGELKQGETVLVHGATGSVGSAAVQLCSALGADVVITGGSDEKLRMIRESVRGTGRVLGHYNYREGGDGSVRDKIKAASPSGTVDVVYDTVGQDGVELMRSLSFGGRYLVVGWTGSPYAGGGRGAGAQQSTANTLPTNLIMMKGARVIGCPVAIHTRRDPTIRARRLLALDEMVNAGLLRPLVSRAHRGLAQVQEALRAKWEREVTANSVIHPCIDPLSPPSAC